jgi:hypothetical protein
MIGWLRAFFRTPERGWPQRISHFAHRYGQERARSWWSRRTTRRIAQTTEPAGMVGGWLTTATTVQRALIDFLDQARYDVRPYVVFADRLTEKAERAVDIVKRYEELD